MSQEFDVIVIGAGPSGENVAGFVVKAGLTGPRAYEDIPTMTQSVDALLDQMHEIDRAEYVLLQDLRAVRGRNDAEFETAMALARPRMSEGFRRLAVLVATSIGRLQVQRYFERDMLSASAFLDEKAALRWLFEE